MDKKKLVKMIIIICIFIVLVILGLLIVKKSMTPSEGGLPEEEPTDLENTEFTSIDSTIKRVSIRNNYYYVKNAITNFITSLDEEYISSKGKEETSEYLYSLLDEQYIEFKGITVENILEILPRYDKPTIVINDMLVSQRSFDISIYFANVIVRENGNNNKISFMLKVDRTNQTYKIFLEDYISQFYPEVSIGGTIEFEDLNNVENDINNIFKYENISNETYAEDLFYNLKFYILYDNEDLYNMLDSEFKKQFSSYSEFYDFISNSYLKYMNMYFGNYNKMNISDEKEKYVLTDESGDLKFTLTQDGPFYYKFVIE